MGVAAQKVNQNLPNLGLSAVVCERLAEPGKASRDVTLMVLGQTSANLVGVPLGSLIGLAVSWRLIFGFIAVLALLLILALTRWLPSMPVVKKPLSNELTALKSWHPWFILSGVAIGSAGFYAYYSYADPPEFGRFRQTKSSQLFDYQRVQSFFKLLSCVHARACL